MADGYSVEDFANKIEWEGGILDALDYGLKSDDLADQTTALAHAWAELQHAYNQLQPLMDKVEKLLPSGDESGAAA